MNLLERYIFKRAFFAFAAVLISLAGVIWIIQALTKVDIFSSNGQSLVAYFTITLLIVPGLMAAIVPIALLISTANSVNTLNANSELVVITAAGASNKLVAKPFLILALICSLIAGAVGNFVMPWSLTKLKQLTSEMNADLLSIVVREGNFSEVDDGLMFHIAKRNPDGSLGGILVSDTREQDKENLYLAQQGVIIKTGNDNLLQLRNGEIHQKDVTTDQTSIIKFTSYVIDMATFGGPKTIGSKRPKERFTTELINVDPNDAYYKKQPQAFTIEIHERLLELFWPFTNVLVLLAFAGQARSSRQGHGASLFTASMILVGLRAAAFAAENSANTNLNAIYVMYLLPVIGIVFGLWCLALNKQVEMPKFLQPYATAFGEMHQRNMQRWANIFSATRRMFLRS